MTVEKIDTQLKLLSGQTMYVGDVPIKPFRLGQVSEIGYSFFQNNINILTLTLDDMINAIDDFELNATLKANKHMYKVFDMYVSSPEMADVFIKSLGMVFRTENILLVGESIEELKVSINDEYYIDRENFDEIVRVIEVQNNPSVSGGKEEDYNPSNDVARSIAEKIRKGKEKVNESRAMESGGEGLNIADMIGAVSTMSNSINKLNIWDLTIYQLYDEFARLNKIDNYKLQIQASAWSSDVEIEHWSEPL